MKVVVSASGPTLDFEVDPRFGRCPLLLIVDMESMGFEVVENPAATKPGGAGIQAAQTAAEKEVKDVITGNCGPNVYQALSSAGIEVIVGATGSVRQAVDAYRREILPATVAASVPPWAR